MSHKNMKCAVFESFSKKFEIIALYLPPFVDWPPQNFEIFISNGKWNDAQTYEIISWMWANGIQSLFRFSQYADAFNDSFQSRKAAYDFDSARSVFDYLNRIAPLQGKFTLQTIAMRVGNRATNLYDIIESNKERESKFQSKLKLMTSMTTKNRCWILIAAETTPEETG